MLSNPTGGACTGYPFNASNLNRLLYDLMAPVLSRVDIKCSYLDPFIL